MLLVRSMCTKSLEKYSRKTEYKGKDRIFGDIRKENVDIKLDNRTANMKKVYNVDIRSTIHSRMSSELKIYGLLIITNSYIFYGTLVKGKLWKKGINDQPSLSCLLSFQIRSK